MRITKQQIPWPAEIQGNGVTLWRGPSRLDGAPIMVVATGIRRTKNPKTGAMLQTYVMRSRINPVTACQDGRDASVCGDCPLRSAGLCYVRKEQAPSMIYQASKRGNYPLVDPRLLSEISATKKTPNGKHARMGSYGDPCAAPYHIWQDLASSVPNWTGYTHQWRQRRFWRFRGLLMASCETLNDAREAQEHGWRTFRTVEYADQLVKGEVMCPAPKTTCEQCGLCNGAGSAGSRKPNIAIVPHGGKQVMANWQNYFNGGKS